MHVGVYPKSASRRDQVQGAILEMAIVRGPGIKLPTVRELCTQFDVSFRTLEHALISLEQQGLVQRRQGSGIYVTERIRQKTIGVVFGGDIFSESNSPFWGLLLKAGRELTAGREDLRAQAYMDISQGHDGLAGHAQLVEDLEARRLHGLLLFALPNTEEIRRLAGSGIPMISPFDDTSPEALEQSHATVQRAASELAARRCRRVACLQSSTNGVSSLRDALGRAGMADAEVLDWSQETWGPLLTGITTHESFGRILMAQRIANRSQEPLPDAIASLQDDTMTRGAITAMLQAGIHPGRDLLVVAQTNKGSPVLEAYAADLIPIEFDHTVIVRAAISRLEDRMSRA